MIVLKNNYFAWLLDNKIQHQESLVTDYDTDNKGTTTQGTTPFVDAFYPSHDVEVSPHEDDIVIVNENDKPTRYRMQHGKSVRAWKTSAKEAKKNNMYKLMLQEYEKELQKDVPTINSQQRLLESKRSKTKLREYTNKAAEGESFKGWSNRASKDMEKLVQSIKEKKKEYKLFSKAFREFYLERNVVAQPRKKQKIRAEHVDVNYNQLWDLGDSSADEDDDIDEDNNDSGSDDEDQDKSASV